MRPQGTRVWSRDGYKARRGESTGRRNTHPVQTTYGQQQRALDDRLTWLWLTARAEMTADLATREESR